MLKIKVQHFQCVPLTSSISIDFHYIRSGKIRYFDGYSPAQSYISVIYDRV